MQITSLYLRDVGCFDELDLRFPSGRDPSKADVHLLVGENGTGKSTILRAMAQFFTLRPTGIHSRLRSPDRSIVGIAVDGEQGALVHGAASAALIRTVLDHDAASWDVVDGTRVGMRSSKDASALRRYRHKSEGESRFAAFAYAGGRTIGDFSVEAIREPDEVPLAEASSFASPRSDVLAQWIAYTFTREMIAVGRKDERAARERRLSVTRLEEALGKALGTPVRFRLDDEPRVAVRVLFRGSWVDPDVLPDGVKGVLSWIGDLLMRMDRLVWEHGLAVSDRPFALFLDEIEAHLHPAWQWTVVPMLQDLFPKAQIFLATHSPFVVASAEDAWVHRLYFDGPTVRVHEPLSSRAGMSYAAVVREVLGVDEQFDPSTQASLDRFRNLRDRALAGEPVVEELETVANELNARSPEAGAIAIPDLRMVRRRLQRSATGS